MLVTALLFVVAAIGLERAPDSTLTITVELTSPAPGIAELFVNHDEQRTLATVTAGHQTLTFAGIRGPLTAIRIDPLAVALQRVTIHRVTILGKNRRELATFSGQEFSTWALFNAQDAAVDSTGLSLTTSTNDTVATSAVEVPTSSGQSRILNSIVLRLRQPWLATELVLGIPIAIMSLSIVVRRRMGSIPLALGPVAVFIALRHADSAAGVTPADQAFGRPGWLGTDATYPRHFLVVALTLLGLVCVIALVLRRQLPLLHRRRPKSRNIDQQSDHNQNGLVDPDLAGSSATTQPSETAVDDGLSSAPGQVIAQTERQPTTVTNWLTSSWHRLTPNPRWFSVMSVPLLFALIQIPSAHQISSTLSGALPQGWDAANVRTWDHLFATGSQPMVDFWYPYGNLIYLRMGVFGATLSWLAETLCLIAFSSALWRLSKRATPVLVGTLAVAAFHVQFAHGGLRYVAPVAIVTLFATTRRTNGPERWAALGAVAITPFIAPDVGIYTLAAAIAVIALDEVAVRGLGDTLRRRRLLQDGAVIATGCVGFILIGLITGSLGPSLSLILDVRSTSAYVGDIHPVRESITQAPKLILYVFPFAAVGLALYAAIRRRGRDLELSWIPVFAGLGVFGLLVLLKHLTRPGLEGILAMTCAATIAVAIASCWHLAKVAATPIVTGALLGTLLIQAQAANSLTTWREQLAEAPSKAIELVAAVTSERDETVLYRPTISREQMAAYPAELAVAAVVATLTDDGRIFVLGDSQFLYPLTDSDPYWAITNYDSSTLDIQRRVVEELGDDPPQVVVVERLYSQFDGVPHVLRVPLIYRWVVEHYVFHSSVEPYDLLTRRQTGDDIDWPYWRRALGTTQDLGRLPAATTAAGASCDLAEVVLAGRCIAYLTIEVQPVDEIVTRTITSSGPSGFFRLKFPQQPGDRLLTIPLGRMWFWTDESVVFVPPDWVIAQEMHGAIDSVLY